MTISNMDVSKNSGKPTKMDGENNGKPYSNGMIWGGFPIIFGNNHISKKSPTGPTERTPKPEYLIALATYYGVRW